MEILVRTAGGAVVIEVREQEGTETLHCQTHGVALGCGVTPEAFYSDTERYREAARLALPILYPGEVATGTYALLAPR